MKSAVETLSPTRAKLTVEVPFEELKPSLDAAYKKIAQQINVPGFRKGKVPADGHRPAGRPRRRARRGDQRRAPEALRPGAAGATTSQPLAQPEIEVTKFEDNEALEFTAEVDVRPEITLPDYDGLEVEVDDVAVTDDDVDEQVQSTCASGSAPSIDVERAAADGDFVTHRPLGHQGRRGRRGRRGDRHELPGRPRRHARGPRRGARRHERRRREDLRLPARRWRPRGRGRRGRGQGHRGQGAGAPRPRRRLRPAGVGVRHGRRAQRGRPRPGSPAASGSSRPPPPATPCSRSCSTWSRSRSPRPSSPRS